MDYKIIINPSHGGDDYGIITETQKEKDLTLEISKQMYNNFKESGIETYLLREKDENLPEGERIKKISQINGDSKNTILITNHYNPDNQDGIEIIYSLKDNDNIPKKITKELLTNNCKTKGYYQKRFPINPMLDYDYLSRNTKNLTPIIINFSLSEDDERQSSIKEYTNNIIKAISDFIKSQKNKNNYYIVKKGDTLSKIAKDYNISIEYLKDLNNMDNNDLKEGEVLIVPITTIKDNDKYKVKKGDTLWNISKKNNISVNELKSANNLDSNLLKIGQELIIPKERTYPVEKGDSIFNITKKFDTDLDILIKENNLSDRNLTIGEEIIIPKK